jgi:hypothetical protein
MQPGDSELYKFDRMVREVDVGTPKQGYQPIRLVTSRGDIACHHYPVVEARRGAVWIGGVGGDWDTPAGELYPQLCRELQQEGIASLRVRYRYSTQLEDSTLDVLTGLSYLQDQGIDKIALTGHSFGGAVAIRAAAQWQAVRTVVTLATQSHGTELAPRLATRCSLLLLHGTDDPILPPSCSQSVYQRALEPKRLILYPGAAHGLDEVAGEVRQVVRDWIIEQLNRAVV